MSIIDLTNKILDDASKEAEYVIKDAETKASEISNTTKILKEGLVKEYEQKEDKALEENKKRVASAAEHAVKLEIDRAKRESVDTIFKDALEQLLYMQDEEYKKIILSLLKELTKDIAGKIIVPEKRVGLTENVLKKADLKYDIETTNKFKGGFIFLGENFESNFVFEEILKNKKNALEVGVAKILFS